MPKLFYIPVNENENHWILEIVFPKANLVSCVPVKTEIKRKASEMILLFLTSVKEVIRAWIFSHGNHQLSNTDNAVLVLVMTMKIATKERIFNSLPIVDLSNWTASQCLRHNFSKSTPNRIKTKIERTHGYKFFIDTPSYTCINSNIYVDL